MGIKPIKRVNVGEQVLLQLKKMLIDGEWALEAKFHQKMNWRSCLK